MTDALRDRTGRPVRVQRDRDHGSAVVESTMVMVLVLALFLGVMQVGFALHVRSTLAAAAAEGARRGAAADGSLRQAERRAHDVAAEALSGDVVQDVVAERLEVDGVPFVRVRLRARLPVLGPWGPGGRMRVDGHALQEGA